MSSHVLSVIFNWISALWKSSRDLEGEIDEPFVNTETTWYHPASCQQSSNVVSDRCSHCELTIIQTPSDLNISVIFKCRVVLLGHTMGKISKCGRVIPVRTLVENNGCARITQMTQNNV